MNKIDKIVKLLLGWIGNSINVLTCSIQYILGLIWIIYSFIRGKNYKKRFTTLNKNAKREFTWILDEYRYYIKNGESD